MFHGRSLVITLLDVYSRIQDWIETPCRLLDRSLLQLCLCDIIWCRDQGFQAKNDRSFTKTQSFASGLQSPSDETSWESLHSPEQGNAFRSRTCIAEKYLGTVSTKEGQTQDLDERIAALLEEADEIEKETFETEDIQDSIDETSSQISNFLALVSSEKTFSTVPLNATGKSLPLAHENTSEEVASRNQPTPPETSTPQVNGQSGLPLEPQGATNEISQVSPQVIQDSSHVQPPQQNLPLPTLNSAPHNNSSHNHSSRLPKLNLPTFSGNPLRWFTFWDSFEAAVHSNTSLGGVQTEIHLS